MSSAGPQLNNEEMHEYCLAIENKAFYITLESQNHFDETLLRLIIRLVIGNLPKPRSIADSLVDIEKYIAKGIKDAQNKASEFEKRKPLIPQFRSIKTQATNQPNNGLFNRPRARL